jgi:peptidoglycan hydrolase-like protein with peptidoglycan-binding domain
MQSTDWVFVIRGGVASALVALFLLCLPALNPAGTAVAQAAEASQATKAPLALGSGYGRPGGSARVRALQRRLRGLDQQPGPVDGLYGPLTQAAVKRFQSSAGLAIDGIAGPQTLRALHAEWPQPVGRGAGYGQRGGSAQVRALQRHLRRADQQPGPVDGVFGPHTEAAVIRFQSRKGLAADGVVGQRTWRALETTTRTAALRADRNEAVRRAMAQLTQQRPAGRANSRLSAFSSRDTVEEDLDRRVLLVIAAIALVAIALTAGLLARREVATELGSPGGSAPAVPNRATAHRPAKRTSALPRRPASESEHSRPSRPAFATPQTTGGKRQGDSVRAIGYVTGADPGALTGPEVRRQIAAIGEVSDKRGLELAEVVRDVRSHDVPGNAQGLAYALDRLAETSPSCLVVAELRRLSDSPAELGRIIESLREREVALIAVDTDLDTSTEHGRLAAEALISAGRLEHRPGSRPSVHDLPALRRHIVALRSSGMALQAIADRLNAEGVPTLRGGKQWRPSSVQVALGYRRPGQGRVAGSLPRGRINRGKEWK